MAQRKANAEAKAAGEPMPYPNPWDGVVPKLEDGASPEELKQWAAAFYRRYAPKR